MYINIRWLCYEFTATKQGVHFYGSISRISYTAFLTFGCAHAIGWVPCQVPVMLNFLIDYARGGGERGYPMPRSIEKISLKAECTADGGRGSDPVYLI